METSLLVGFIGVALVAYLVPGPDWLIVLKGATAGPRRGAVTGLGSQTGLLVHGLLATMGVSALIAAAPGALIVIQVLGALYLLYLAITGLMGGTDEGSAAPVGWREGFITNITNPKVIVFFVAIAPQFVGSGQPIWLQMFILTLLDVIIGILWWTLLACALSPLVTRIGIGRINVVASVLLTVVALGLLAVTAAEHL
ncbi:LysE family translocator [Rhodococcoides yunnanense]|uniref:LysE family translocator n=1 Tax=Rhodococcoides yunnanense TaxID=278209 RepID=UPI000933F168|nr:LysE family transporter [Rhodococcus yunnanensis]